MPLFIVVILVWAFIFLVSIFHLEDVGAVHTTSLLGTLVQSTASIRIQTQAPPPPPAPVPANPVASNGGRYDHSFIIDYLAV